VLWTDQPLWLSPSSFTIIFVRIWSLKHTFYNSQIRNNLNTDQINYRASFRNFRTWTYMVYIIFHSLSLIWVRVSACHARTHARTHTCVYTGHLFKCKTCTNSSVTSLYNSFPVVSLIQLWCVIWRLSHSPDSSYVGCNKLLCGLWIYSMKQQKALLLWHKLFLLVNMRSGVIQYVVTVEIYVRYKCYTQYHSKFRSPFPAISNFCKWTMIKW
jgi:hypothetical protein